MLDNLANGLFQQQVFIWYLNMQEWINVLRKLGVPFSSEKEFDFKNVLNNYSE